MQRGAVQRGVKVAMLAFGVAGELGVLLGTTGKRRPKGNTCGLVFLCRVPSMLLKVPQESHKIVDEIFAVH